MLYCITAESGDVEIQQHNSLHVVSGDVEIQNHNMLYVVVLFQCLVLNIEISLGSILQVVYFSIVYFNVEITIDRICKLSCLRVPDQRLG